MTASHFHRSGVIRREIIQVGFSGFLGLGMTGLLARRAWADRSRVGKHQHYGPIGRAGEATR